MAFCFSLICVIVNLLEIIIFPKRFCDGIRIGLHTYKARKFDIFYSLYFTGTVIAKFVLFFKVGAKRQYD